MKKVIEKEDFKKTDPNLITFNGKLPTIEELKRLLMEEAMKRACGNRSIVSKVLGVSRQRVIKSLENGG